MVKKEKLLKKLSVTKLKELAKDKNVNVKPLIEQRRYSFCYLGWSEKNHLVNILENKVKISDIESYIGKKKITRKGKEEEKKTRIPKKKIKEFLRKKYWKNKFLGECYCCGEPLTFDHAQLGRIKSGREDGEYTVENCGLICQTCNSAMREMNMKDFMKKHFPSQYQKHFGSKDKTKTTSGTKRRKPVKRKTITSKRRKL